MLQRLIYTLIVMAPLAAYAETPASTDAASEKIEKIEVGVQQPSYKNN
jgi:hypothetical protein